MDPTIWVRSHWDPESHETDSATAAMANMKMRNGVPTAIDTGCSVKAETKNKGREIELMCEREEEQV